MNFATYDDQGIRFEYPKDWGLEVTEDGLRTTASVQSPSGLAFALVTVDEEEPDPEALVKEALAALREEYPDLVAEPTEEIIDHRPSVGVDVEFFSLELANTCNLRSYQTPRRTVFVLTQWSDLEPLDSDLALRTIRQSIEETDA